MATSGSSGGMVIPDGKTLPAGTVVFGFNNSLGPEYAKYARGDNYQFGIGLFDYVEFSGRLSNYPQDKNGVIGVRDLSANLKVSLPKLFDYQPDIAFGINDLAGGAAFFKSKYVAVSDTFGPLRVTVGGARGEPYLSRIFGGAELALGNSGLSLVAEHDDHAIHAGLRYGSAPVASLGNMQLVATVQRAFGAHAPDGSKFERSSLGLNLVIPFGANARHASIPPAPAPAVGTAFNGAATDAGQPAQIHAAALPQLTAAASAPVTIAAGLPMKAAATPVNAAAPLPSLPRLQAELIKAGLERVRVGRMGSKLVIEYENHRYNQNEVDAIGIALGLGALLASDDVTRIAVVTKKAGLALYKTSVERDSYRAFLRDGTVDVSLALTLQYRPGDGDQAGEQAVQWLNPAEGPRGYSRVRIDPILVKFVGTEIGVFDYSLAANIQALVPLWKGAELATSYVVNVADSENVKNYGFFSYAHQRNGFKAAVLSQSFWLVDDVLNVTTAGKFLYDASGVQNETVWFVPGLDDQVRLQYTRLHAGDESALYYGTAGGSKLLQAGGVSYLLNYQPLNVSVEAGYNRYAARDHGPSLQLNRWFGDIEAQIFMRKSNLETRVGFGLSFPLTPRQGMKPGLMHLEGSENFPFQLETKYANGHNGGNYINRYVVQELSLLYSSRTELLNRGRIGRDYLLSQLQRMREAILMYAPLMP